MNERVFIHSISWMIAAILLILSFIRGSIQPWLLAAAFAAWAVYLAIRMLLPKAKQWHAKVKPSAKKPKKQPKEPSKEQCTVEKAPTTSAPKEEPSVLIKSDELERLLLGHINCRISEKLKSAYPQATWQWCPQPPEGFIRGGTGRIRTFHTEDYTHAEVTIGEYFKIAFKMMKIADFPTVGNTGTSDEADTEPAAETEPKVVDPAIWYDLVGREVLTGLIRDWSTRGHTLLHIAADGNVYFTEGADEIKTEQLREFPTKPYWPELAKCLEKDDLKIQLLENRMTVAWG